MYDEAILFALGHRSLERGSDNLGSLLNSSAVSRGEKEGSVTLTFYPISSDESYVKRNIIRVKRVFHETKSQFFVSAPAPNGTNLQLRKVGRDEMCDILRRYGLEVNFSDRYSLLQNQTASFGNRSPIQLLEYIESFIGNEEIIAIIKERVCSVSAFFLQRYF